MYCPTLKNHLIYQINLHYSDFFRIFAAGMANNTSAHRLQPYEGIIRFVIAMLAANYFWKFTVLGDEYGYGAVTWFGFELTYYFDCVADHIAGIVYTILQGLGNCVTLINGNHLRFTDNGAGTIIVWGCTGIKQAFIWLVIMLAARGRWLDKLWYIPLGWVCAYAFNIFRIAMVALLTHHHPEWFEFLHTYLFKYLFYAMFFLLWWIYDERITPQSRPQHAVPNTPSPTAAGSPTRQSRPQQRSSPTRQSRPQHAVPNTAKPSPTAKLPNTPSPTRS